MLFNKQSTKTGLIRIVSLLMVLLLVIQPMQVGASSTPQKDLEILDSTAGELDSPKVEPIKLGSSEKENLQLGESITITSEPIIRYLGDESEIDFMAGVSAIDENETDLTSKLEITNLEFFDRTIPGIHSLVYAIKNEEGLFVATHFRIVAILGEGITIEADDLRIYASDFRHDEETCENPAHEDKEIAVKESYKEAIMTGVIAQDTEGYYYNEIIDIVDDGGFTLDMVENKLISEFTVSYSIFDADKKEVAAKTRVITVSQIALRASSVTGDNQLGGDGKVKGSLKVTGMASMRTTLQMNLNGNGTWGSGNCTNTGMRVLVGTKTLGVNPTDIHPSAAPNLSHFGLKANESNVTVTTSGSTKYITRTWTNLGGMGVDFVWEASYTNGAGYYNHKWTITNIKEASLNNVKLYYGGHHQYGGSSNGWSEYNAANSEITTYQDKTAGMVSLKSTGAERPESYYAQHAFLTVVPASKVYNGENFTNVIQDKSKGDKGDHVGYYMQWGRSSLSPNESLTVTAQEGLMIPSTIMIIPPDIKHVPKDVTVTHTFEIRNVSSSAAITVDLAAVSSKGWAFSFPNGQKITIPKDSSVSFPVDLVVPKTAVNNDTDNLKLTATYTDGGTQTVDGTAITIVDNTIPYIENTTVMRQTNTELDVKVDYLNLAGSNETTIEVYTLDGKPTLVPAVKQSIATGGIVTKINISSLSDGVTYRIFAQVKGIDFPHRETTFTKATNPTGMTVTPATVTLKPTQTQQITATITPANANPAVKYSGFDSSVISVSSTGLITAIKPGVTTVTTTSAGTSSLFGTTVVTVSVPTTGIDLGSGEDAFYLRPTTDRTVAAIIKPADATNKDTTWVSASPAIATVAKTSAATANPQTAKITAVKEGVAKVTVSSADNATVKKEITVKVDGTAPNFTTKTVTKTTSNWRVVTNKAMRLQLAAADPVLSGTTTIGSGVDKIYYRVVAGTTAPTFSLAATTDWLSSNNTVDYTFNASKVPNLGVDGIYSVFAVTVDKVGNVSNVEKIGENIDVDTSVPIITFPPSLTLDGRRDIHVLEGETADLMKGVTVTDNGKDVISDGKLTITPNSVNTDKFGNTFLTYTYSDQAGNSAFGYRWVIVHERPKVTTKSPVVVNKNEGTINLLKDVRIDPKNPDVTYYVADKGGTPPGYDPEKATTNLSVTGEFVTDGILDLTKITGNNTIVVYKATYYNPTLKKDVTTTLNVTITLGENGTTGPTVTVPPGVVIPPTGKPNPDPGLNPEKGPDPTKPGEGETGVNRIEYYQNHGVKLNPNGTQGSLTIADIEKGVISTGINPTVTIDGAPLTASSLSSALSKIGQYTIVYTFTNDKGTTYFTVYLRVNSDMTKTTKDSINTVMSQGFAEAMYTGANGITAEYTNYLKTVVKLAVTATPIDDLKLNTINTQNIVYTAPYPFKAQTVNRKLHVHGGIALTANDVHIRATNNVDQALRTGTSSIVHLAPVNVGTVPITINATYAIDYGTPNGDPSKVSQFRQKYSVEYKLGYEYGPNAASEVNFSRNNDRTITVHGNPEITANDINVGLAYTKAMFGTASTNSRIDLKSSVSYYSKAATDLKALVTVEGENGILFGTAGSYKMTFKVTDQSATGRPTDLTPVATEKVVYVNISEGGSALIFEGVKEQNWLQGEAITHSDLTKGIVLKEDGKISNSNIDISIKNSGGADITLSEMVKNPGVYTATYSAVDSSGNKGSVNSKVNVYGRLVASANQPPENRRENSGTYTTNFDLYNSEYKDPQGKTVAITYKTNSAMYSSTGTVNLAKRGKYEAKVTIKHPVFPALNSVTSSIEVRVHGPIVITGTESLETPKYTGDGAINILTGVGAEYINYQDVKITIAKENLSTNQTGNSASSAVAGKKNVVISAKDPLIPSTPTTKTVEMKFNLTPVLKYRSSTASIEVSKILNRASITNLFAMEYNHGQLYNQTYPVNLPVTFDFNYELASTKAGTYPIKASITDGNGKKVETDLSIIIIAAPVFTVGWTYLNSNWYYINAAGQAHIGWLTNSDGSKQYTDKTGARQTGLKAIDGKTYYFDSAKDGKMQTGWQSIAGKKYYFNTSGHMQTGWQTVGGQRYYLNSSGVVQIGWRIIDNQRYYLNAAGVMQTGWQAVDGSWYLLNTAGVMQTGWQTIGGSWYLLNTAGVMQTGWQLMEGKWYYFNTSGVMQTAWQTISGTWYYFNGSGQMLTDWQLVAGAWYYFNGSGQMQTNWLSLGGSWYYFNASGVMQTGWQLIDGTWYLFNASGVMQ